MRFRHIFLWAGLSWLSLSGLACGRQAAPALRVFCWDLTPTTIQVIEGLTAGLGQPLPVISADASYQTGEQQIRQLRQEKLSLLVVLGTPALILTAPAIKRTPVVFAMVADPFQTGAAYNPDQPEDHQDNITGLASPPPLKEAIQELRRLFPAKRHWGLIYDPADGSSQELRQHLTRELAAAEQTLTLVSWAQQPQAEAAVQELIRQGVEVAFIPPDGTAPRYAAALLAAGQNRKLLVVNGNPRVTGSGAVLHLTLDYEALGREAAALARRVLAGERPKNIPISTISPVKITVAEGLLNRWLGYPPGRGR